MTPFGRELLLDCYDCNPEKIDDLNVVYDFLESAVEMLGVSQQAPPFVFHSPTGFPDKAGISAWIPLIESGIQCHTLTEKNFVSIDYYTCGNLDKDMEENLINLAKDRFGAEDHESKLVIRGKYYEEVVIK